MTFANGASIDATDYQFVWPGRVGRMATFRLGRRRDPEVQWDRDLWSHVAALKAAPQPAMIFVKPVP